MFYSYEGDASFLGIFNITKFNERFNKPETMGKYNLFKAYFNESDSMRREQSLKNFARLNVYIADGNVVKIEESPDYTGSDVISDIGGQLGLWVGISVITLAEVLALMADILSYLLGKCHKRTEELLNSNNNNKEDAPPTTEEMMSDYAKVRTTEETDDEDELSHKNGTSTPKNPIYMVSAQPRKNKRQPIHIKQPPNNQWASKFVDYNSKKPSIPGGINLRNEYSEV